MTVVDCHTHVASRDTERYPMVSGQDWFHGGAVDVEGLLAAMDGAGVDRACVVQYVGAYGYDCRYAADAVASAPERLALVTAIDMDDPVVHPAARAVRAFGVRDASWLDDGRGERVWAMAAEAGTGIVPTLWARDLPKLRPLIERRPGVAIAVDHCGFPDPVDVVPPELVALADLPSVHCKVSTHVLHPVAEPAAFVGALTAAFGERICWGSDFPQTQSPPYPGMVELAERAVSGLSAAARDAFLGGTSLRLWF